MILLSDVAAAFEIGKEQYEGILKSSGCRGFYTKEQYGKGSLGEPNRIGAGENLEYMEFLLKEKNMAGKLQLIYVDPPFFSKGQYESSFRLESERLGKSSLIKLKAYNDRWEQGMKEYLAMLTVRLFLMKELLSETGCIWVHLDWHAAHYVKLLLDQIFGEKNFINEVIWTYKSGGANKRSFAKKHDNLLLYGKSRKYTFNLLKEKSYNRQYKPYRFKGVKEYRDETGWYTMVNMKDVWNIDMVGRTSAERTGYATQKPEKLMERIVASCSNEGDICADFFAGSGTLGAVCEKMGRRWIMCDEGEPSIAEQTERLSDLKGAFSVERRDEGKENSAGEGTQNRETFPGKLDIMISDDKIELLSYCTDIRCNLGKNHKEIQKYIEDDSLSMIRCWSIDTDFDGVVHRADSVMKGSQRCCFRKLRKGCRVSIAGYDVMGGRFFETIEI